MGSEKNQEDAKRITRNLTHCLSSDDGRSAELDGRRTVRIGACRSILRRFSCLTRMWANAQRDGRPAEHRWRPLFNAAKFG